MIALIVAFDDEKLIGKDGTLPWYFKEDLAYFKKITEHHKVVMGRVTYESILKSLKHPLPNRENIVVTRQRLNDSDITVVNDLEHYLKAIKPEEKVFVIGGRMIYNITLPYADKLYITHVKGRYHGDTYFPDYDESKFTCISKEVSDELTFAVYERVN